MKTNPSDAERWKPGDEICVILSRCDPPTLDLFRAADAAFDQGKFSAVWLCPLFVDDDQTKRSSPCSFVLCSEYYAASHRVLTHCSIALDKRIGDVKSLVEWFKDHWPKHKIRTCMMATERGSEEVDFVVTFSGQESLQYKKKWSAGKYLQSPPDMAMRISSGSNESRWFPHGLWEFLLEKGLYRSK